METKKVKKFLLITPPAFTPKGDAPDINPVPPLGLGYLASVLERRGIEVKVFDSLVEGWGVVEEISSDLIRIGAPLKRIEEEIRNFSPDVVGVSNLFSRQSKNAHMLYEIIKKIDQNITVVSGGAHPTVATEFVMRDKNVDYVVIGEGEQTLVKLVDHIEGRCGIDTIDGISFRRGEEAVYIPKKTFIQDLDSLPFPARHLLNMEKYFGLPTSHGKRRHIRFSPIVTSRGCPANCTFCTAHKVWGKPFRKRSPENVLKEMRELKYKYGIKEILFEDDNVTLDVKRAEEIFDMMIREGLEFEWDTPNGVAAFALNESLIRKMKESGCYKLNIAVESGNQSVLKNIIKKPLDLEKVKGIVDYGHKIGLEVSMFLIIGMPGETIEQMKESYRFAKRLGIYNPFVSVATPYPGSELYNLCVSKRYIKEEDIYERLYIRSFSISTELWTGKDVRNVFNNGYLYLQFHYLKRHPLLFLKKIAEKLYKNPKWFIKKAVLLCQRTKI